jgi:hypothetical protein
MIWILLGGLGVPIWLIVGALGGAFWSRRKFQHSSGVFPCKVRIAAGSEDLGKWPRTTVYARWVHDVLLVHAGLALVRYRALPVGRRRAYFAGPGCQAEGRRPHLVAAPA